MFGQSSHGRVEERPAYVELDVFGALRFERHTPLTGHDARTNAATSAATVQIAATSSDAAAATATYTSDI